MKTVKIGNLSVNLETGAAEMSGKPVRLGERPRAMLRQFAARPGMTLSHEFLLTILYPEAATRPERKIIDVMVCNLRKRLAGANDGQTYLETDWGRGYAMREPRA